MSVAEEQKRMEAHRLIFIHVYIYINIYIYIYIYRYIANLLVVLILDICSFQLFQKLLAFVDESILWLLLILFLNSLLFFYNRGTQRGSRPACFHKVTYVDFMGYYVAISGNGVKVTFFVLFLIPAGNFSKNQLERRSKT